MVLVGHLKQINSTDENLPYSQWVIYLPQLLELGHEYCLVRSKTDFLFDKETRAQISMLKLIFLSLFRK